MKKLKRLRTGLLPHRLAVLQTVLLLVASFMVFTAPVSATIRFNDRSLFVLDPEPSVVSRYVLSFTYNNLDVPSTTVGSLDLLFCQDPIPEDPCVAPPGLDASHATLTDQTGVTGYSISSATTSEIILTRTPGTIGETPSTYTFDGIINPSLAVSSYGIRMSDPRARHVQK